VFVRKGLFILLAVSLFCDAAAGESADLRVTPVVLAVRKAGPSVVNISTEQIVERRYDPFFGFGDPLFEEFFRPFMQHMPRTGYKVHSLGSGVIISPDGYVITNGHVILRASKITVTLADNREFEAEVLNSSPEIDLGVMKLDSPSALPYATLGDSSELMIGETLIAVGNPFGLENSVTTGVLSATGRSLGASEDVVYRNLLQTTALINPGNSGGPLLNLDAKVVGLNTAMKLDAQGIGFGIPVNDIRLALVGLLDFESVKNTSLGIGVPGDPSVAVIIESVRHGGPGAYAGIIPEDLILKVDDRPVSGVLDYEMAVLRKEVGDELVVDVDRNGEILKLKLQIGEAPPPAGAELVRRRVGAVVYPLSAYVARRLGVPTDFGILVHDVEADTPADSIGLKPNDVIVSWGGRSVGNVSRLASEVDRIPAGGRVVVGVLRGEYLLEALLQVK